MSRRFDHLGDVETFITVVDKGSLTAAAIALATTASVLSRAISRLETRLGAQLLRRTTRRLSLTEPGRLYLEQARQAFVLIEDAERGMRGTAGELAGRVRLSVPTTYGHHRLPSLLSRFSQRYPKVGIDLSITNRNVDLAAEGYDLAIRLGPLPDSRLVSRHLEDVALCLLAAPAYGALAGMPTDIEALARHACLPFVMPSTGRISPWMLRDDKGKDIDWAPQAGVRLSDDVLGVVSLALAGLGICQTFDFIGRDLIAQGRAVEVLPQARGRSRPISVIYAPHRQLSAAARALIDFLVDPNAD
ncbi:LysR family transcriptional regulator [Xylophilus sp. GOD-11R]|uniref:LysR family transcriptional regulator n=1 Tax=Xylophilus sp. GOD-11R TaxID=3089814 RepID=UPI00298CD42C|nr:LysR substrate-binding domain-containing protein [Xylophilus sp. GOD-11R]WPB58064.1 LysR substrate-binding domain-containing protein [Xylophilus sp. GOD-11R]